MHRYFTFITAGLALLVSSISITVVAVALPSLTGDLGTNILWAAWSISIYQLATTVIMPLAGRASDSLGHRRVFLLSLGLFTLSSFFCGVSPNIHFLLLFRFFQGIGGGCFLPAAAGIVASNFPENRQAAIGLFSSIFAIGGLVGPNLGGWIVEDYSWRYLFFLNVPLGVALIGLMLLSPKESETVVQRSFDLAGVALLSATIFLLMLGFNFVSEKPSIFYYVLAALFFAASGYLNVLFFRHEKKAKDPILDIALFKSRPFLAANLYNVIMGVGLLGVFSFVPFYAISVYKLSTFASGMILTPRSVGVIAASAVTSFLLTRWGYRWPMVWGLVITSLATILLGQGPDLLRLLDLHMGPTEFLALLMLLSGIGIGITLPASNNACIELMPEKVATITGLRGMFRSVGGVLGISLITTVLHLSSNPTNGFKIAFTSFGLGLLFAFPLIFLMPTGK